MRRRLSARLLVVNGEHRVLLFRFVFKRGPLAGQDYWATPGGALEEGEDFAEAARRELFEETGMIAEIGPEVARQEFALQLPDGESVIAEERFVVVRALDDQISRDHWTALEVEVMAEHRWWSIEEIRLATQTIYPQGLADMLSGIERSGDVSR